MMKKQGRLLILFILFITSSIININASQFKNNINLTKNEINYLSKKKQITMCIDPDWMPYEKIQNGKHIGMSADFIKIIEREINTPITLMPTKTWSQTIGYAKNRTCDIFSLAKETPSRKKYMNFTKPYFDFPVVIATTHEKPYLTGIENILDKPVGIVKGYAIIELLKNRYPSINIVEVNSPLDGLKKVKNKELYGYLDSLITIGYELQRGFVSELKVSGQLDINFSLSIGSRNDEPLLHRIMEKATSSVSEKTKQKIINDWISVKIDKEVDHSLLGKFVLGALVLFILFLYRHLELQKVNSLLGKKVKDKTKELQRVNDNLEQTVKKRTEDLKDSNEVFQLMLHSTMEAIFILEYDHCMDANNAAISLLGYDNNENIIGTFVFDIIDKNSHEFLSSGDNLSKGNSYEVKAIKKDGSIFPALIKIQSLKTEHKTIKILTLLDLTQLKEHEIKLINQSKMASLGELIGNIAHQWRQPLAAITTAASGIRMQKELDILSDDELYKSCDDIVTSSTYLSDTINDFRHLIKGDTLKKDYKVNNTIKQGISLVKNLLDSNLVKIINTFDKELVFNGYSNDLTQIIINILKNSNDAFSHTEQISEKFVFIETITKDKNLIILIKDNAGGIPSDILEKIFEPYFTTKHKAQGTGLGLYMTHQIINNSFKGSIDVINETYEYNDIKYNGAKFTITLPIKE